MSTQGSMSVRQGAGAIKIHISDDLLDLTLTPWYQFSTSHMYNTLNTSDSYVCNKKLEPHVHILEFLVLTGSGYTHLCWWIYKGSVE